MATLTVSQATFGKVSVVSTGEETCKTGLIVGFQMEMKYFAIAFAFTPHTQMESAGSLEALLSAPVDTEDNHYSDWIIEHTRQAVRMLPAGLSVLGLFVCSSDEQLQDFKSRPPVLKTLLQLVEDMNKEVLKKETVLLLHILNERQKNACRLVDAKDSRVGVVEVKQGTIPRLEEIRGICKLDAHFSDPNVGVRDGVEKILTNIASKLNFDRLIISHKSEGPLPALKSETDFHTVEIRSPSIGSYLSHSKPPQVQVSISGAIETRAYIPSKSTVNYAAEMIRSDIVQSLKYRLSLYYEGEDLGMNLFGRKLGDLGTEAGIYGLPYRVFYRTDTGVSVCDYVFEGENATQSTQRLTEIIGMTGVGEAETTEQLTKTETVKEKPQSEVLKPVVPETGNKEKPYPWWMVAAAVILTAVLVQIWIR